MSPRYYMKQLILVLLLPAFTACFAQSKKTYFVADHKSSCVGAGPMDCYLVKEKTKDEWRYFYNFIEGFDYQEGFEYKIKVSVTQYEQVAADASRFTYRLLKVMAKRKTNYNPTEKLPGKWVLEYIHQDTTFIRLIDSTSAFMELNTRTGKLSGKNICNSFFGPFKATGQQIEIGDIGSTRMMCEGMQLENIIFKMLRDMKTWSIKANRLTLYSANQLDRLEFYQP